MEALQKRWQHIISSVQKSTRSSEKSIDGIAPQSLEELFLSGACNKPFGEWNDGGRLSSVLISRYAYQILDQGIELGFRVIECRADSINDETKTIRFVCFQRIESKDKSGWKYLRNFFNFQFRNGAVDYAQMKEKLFREEGGKLVARHRFVLIATDWKRCWAGAGERQNYRGECLNERCFFIPDAPQNYTPEK